MTPTELFTEPVASISALAVDDANVYWTDVSDGVQLHRVSKCGGPAALLASNLGVGGPIIVRAGFVYGYGLVGLARVSVNGGGYANYGQPSVVRSDFVIDDQTMFTARQNDTTGATDVVAYSLVDRSTRLLAPSAWAYYARISVDCARVFFTIGTDYKTQLQSVPRGGGAVTTLTPLEFDPHSLGWEAPGPLVMDNEFLYWVRLDGDLLRVKKDGTDVQTLAVHVPSMVADDDLHVYFLRKGANAIERVPKVGGAVESVTPTQNVRVLAVDSGSVFWAEATVASGGGYRIMKIDK